MHSDKIEKIKELKEREDVLILAHYYTNDEVQDIADYLGDSYYLNKIARDSDKQKIVFCGVEFMAESSKVLSEEKTILLPDITADCPMAKMVIPEDIKNIRAKYDDLAVVCYINSTLEAKANSDVIVTSSNALKIVSKLPNKNIFFIPDENLGKYIAKNLPEKNFIFHDGYCHVHTSIEKNKLIEAKKNHREAKVLSHPECRTEILELSDYIGSTSGIIDYAIKSDKKEFIICTELGILHYLHKKTKGKKFYSVGHRQFCPSMKKISLDNIINSLENNIYDITVDRDLAENAARALMKMHELAI
ncbi:MAG: quinolinate synthase NadA [Clostridiales Family XIII bacterium]|jgi:quinolinate synthase|nr:quinolinate synthase NadA [Clostridiales Family XIII bacterium]